MLAAKINSSNCLISLDTDAKEVFKPVPLTVRLSPENSPCWSLCVWNSKETADTDRAFSDSFITKRNTKQTLFTCKKTDGDMRSHEGVCDVVRCVQVSVGGILLHRPPHRQFLIQRCSHCFMAFVLLGERSIVTQPHLDTHKLYLIFSHLVAVLLHVFPVCFLFKCCTNNKTYSCFLSCCCCCGENGK